MCIINVSDINKIYHPLQNNLNFLVNRISFSSLTREVSKYKEIIRENNIIDKMMKRKKETPFIRNEHGGIRFLHCRIIEIKVNANGEMILKSVSFVKWNIAFIIIGILIQFHKHKYLRPQ